MRRRRRRTRGTVRARGRPSGALALIEVWIEATTASPDHPDRFAALFDAYPYPAYVAVADGTPRLVNRAGLEAVGASSLEDAQTRGQNFDPAAMDLAREALISGTVREGVRWSGTSSGRQALRIRATPVAGREAAVWSWDVTAAEGCRRCADAAEHGPGADSRARPQTQWRSSTATSG